MNKKQPLLNKLRPGNSCKYIGEDKKYGLLKGRNYYIIERLPNLIAFSSETEIGIDFGLNDEGDYFSENWQILNEDILKRVPDFDYEKEKDSTKYLKYEFRILNGTI